MLSRSVVGTHGRDVWLVSLAVNYGPDIMDVHRHNPPNRNHHEKLSIPVSPFNPDEPRRRCPHPIGYRPSESGHSL